MPSPSKYYKRTVLRDQHKPVGLIQASQHFKEWSVAELSKLGNTLAQQKHKLQELCNLLHTLKQEGAWLERLVKKRVNETQIEVWELYNLLETRTRQLNKSAKNLRQLGYNQSSLHADNNTTTVHHEGLAILQLQGDVTGHIIDIPLDGIIIGRDHLNQASRQLIPKLILQFVSRQHCRIEYNDHGFQITHIGQSLNNTFVNGERIIGSFELKAGDTIQLSPNTPRFVFDFKPKSVTTDKSRQKRARCTAGGEYSQTASGSDSFERSEARSSKVLVYTDQEGKPWAPCQNFPAPLKRCSRIK